MTAAARIEFEPAPTEIDPPTCEQCGCVIEDLEALIYLRVADLVTQWELANPRDRWRHTGARPTPTPDVHAPARPYRTPVATVDAFFYLVRLGDADRLRQWIDQHPLDAPELYRLWEDKNART